jgi:hypothetical protein
VLGTGRFSASLPIDIATGYYVPLLHSTLHISGSFVMMVTDASPLYLQDLLVGGVGGTISAGPTLMFGTVSVG